MLQAERDPVAPVPDAPWPLENPVLASVLWCLLLLAIFVPLTLRLYNARTSD